MNINSVLKKNLWMILLLVVLQISFAQDIPLVPEQQEPNFQGYIIQFQEQPVLERRAALESDIYQREARLNDSSSLYRYTIGLISRAGIAYSKSRKDSRVESQKSRILEEHRAALADIQARVPSITGYAAASQKTEKQINEYTDVFNGIALDITSQEAEQLRESPYIKAVYPNYKVNITLMDSVPLINATQVWQLDEDGNNCSITGKECLTGKNVTIAIIDTGVDYTHLDLGGTGEEVFFPVYPIKMDLDIDNNLIYWADHETNQINYLNLTDNTTGTIISDGLYRGTKILAVDKNNGKVYWLQEECFDPDCFWTTFTGIVRSDLSGDNIELVCEPEIYEDDEKELFTDIKIDLINEKIYWMSSLQYIAPIQFFRNEIKRADLDGSNVETIVPFFSNNTPIVDIALDNVNNKIYWAEIMNERIVRADFDGSNVETIVSNPGMQIRTIALDIPNSKIYFTGTGNIKRADLDGSNIEIIHQFENPYRNGLDLEIDSNGGKIYWIDSGTIERADLDGSDYEEDIFQGVEFPGFGCEDCKVIDGFDFVNNDSNPIDDNGHGTHCAATAAGNGTLKGVAPDAKIYAYKVLTFGGWGYWDWIIAAIEISADPNQDGDFSDHVDVISMSLGGSGDPDDPISTAVDNAVDAGITAVIAAGNSGPNEKSIGSPGTARKAITVAASDKFDNIASFSSRGPVIWPNGSIIKPDIAAPGVDICAAQWNNAWSVRECLDTEHTSISGTSMATPHVAGAAALLLQKNPGWTPKQVKMALRSTAKDLVYHLIVQGYGRIDILDAVQLDDPCIAEIEAKKNEGSVDLIGTAYCNSINNYTLYLAPFDYNFYVYSPGALTELYSSKDNIIDGNLYPNFDTANLNDGLYIVRLEVFDNFGNIYYDHSLLQIENFNFKVGDTLNYIKGEENITGSINIQGYDAYKIEYQKEDAKTWNQICYSESRPAKDVLCSIDVSSFDNGVYYFRVLAYKEGNWISSNPLKTAVVKEMVDNWPVEINGFPKGQLNIDKLNNKLIVSHFSYCIQGSMESESSNAYYNPTNVKIFSSNTPKTVKPSEFDNSYIFNNAENNIYSSDAGISTECYGSALYIYDSNGSLNQIDIDIDDWSPSIYPNKEQNQNYIALTADAQRKAALIDIEGNYIVEWPEYNHCQSGSFAIHDIDGKNNSELFNVKLDCSTGNITVHGFNNDGTDLDNFPINVSKGPGDYSLALLRPQLLMPEQRIAVLTGSLNFDAEWWAKDLILFFDVYDLNGTLINRTELMNRPSARTDLKHLSFIGADVDNDNNNEFIVGYSFVDTDLFLEDQYNNETYKSIFKIFDENGSLISEIGPIKGDLLSKFAVADLGYDKLNIIAGLSTTWANLNNGERLMSFDYLGNISFDTNLQDYDDFINGLVVSDIDSDNEQEIIINYRPRWWNNAPSGVQIFSKDGILEKEIEIPTMGEVDDFWGYDPIISDFNNDGKMDLIQQSLYRTSDGNYNTRIYALDLGGNYLEEKLEWPMYMHDSQRTGIHKKLTFDCIDSDNGLNYSAKGYIEINGEKSFDECDPDLVEDEDTLLEYFCTGDRYEPGLGLLYRCPYGCEDGACKRAVSLSKSVINNSEDVDITGKLKLSVQKLENDEWVDDKIIVQDLTIIVPANSFVELPPIWEKYGPYDTTRQGIFRVYAEFNFNSQSINSSYEFNVARELIKIEGVIELIPPVKCGNQLCEEGETVENCPEDCIPISVCGNSVCEPEENYQNCPQDCKNVDLVFVSKASDRYVITDMAVWNNKLYYGTNNHGSCEDVGEVYKYPCTLQEGVCRPIGDFDYFQQQGMKYIRYGYNNILVPGLDPPGTGDLNYYDLFVYDGGWKKHNLKPDTGGHLVDVAYFNGKYYVLTNQGFVVVKNPKDYDGEGDYLLFEAKPEDIISEKPGPYLIVANTLRVWENSLYLLGSSSANCDPKTDPNCKPEYTIWKYDGEGNVKEYYTVTYNLNLGISEEFKNNLYVRGADGLYKTENGINYAPIEFFNGFIPSSQEESRMISDITILDNKIYVSVMVGKFDIPGVYTCNNEPMSIGSCEITSYEIYSSDDGISWDKIYNKSVFVKNYPDINFPIEAMEGKLYVGMTESQVIKGNMLLLLTNLYVYTPQGSDICDNNGCSACISIEQSCITTCGDCPALHSCRPGMDCSQCYQGHPDCKYWTCKNNLCGINQW
ncbi:S8 family serine peptidase [Candidatus Woesearchaeota archaeon]|nr:S8 family serine peptidase [Candidatus Woesearchaeota archaeon]